ncbi:MAG: LPS export ABC transporter periplasmic protein LptC [Gammaproteobacteria bacterium]
MTWQGALVVLLLVAAAVVSWLLGRGTGTAVPGVAPRPVPDVGYYFEDVSFLETGTDGAVLYEVAAESAVQMPEAGLITLRDVHLDYNARGEGPWVLDAERGRIPEERNRIELSGGVTLRSEESETPTVVETESLTVDPEQQLATTTDEVRIRVGPHVLTGTGMQARLDSQEVELESSVRGEFVP